MTFQPPSGPPGSTPPPPPPPAARGGFDPKSMNPLDWGIIGAGVLVFLFSFIDFYDGGDVTINGRTIDIPDSASQSFSAWHGIFGGGFFAWFAMIFAIAGSAVVAMMFFSPQTKLKVPNRLAGLGLYAAAAVFEIISIFVTPGYDFSGIDTNGASVDSSAGHGFGFWVSLILIIAGLVLSLMRLQATGGQLPGGLSSKVPNIGGYGPQDAPGSGPAPGPGPRPGTGTDTPPPPPSYGPPQ